MPIYVVERVFSPPLTEEEFAATRKVLGPCIRERDIKHIRSHFATDGSRAFCVYEAADAERVREANRTSGVPFERVWSTTLYP